MEGNIVFTPKRKRFILLKGSLVQLIKVTGKGRAHSLIMEKPAFLVVVPLGPGLSHSYI